MLLQITVGQSSHIGAREHNEDYAGCVTPETSIAQVKGALLADRGWCGWRRSGSGRKRGRYPLTVLDE